MTTKIKYPLFFQSLSGSMSFKIIDETRGIKVDKHNIMMDPEEVSQIVKIINLCNALEQEEYLTEVFKRLNLVPIEAKSFEEIYYSVMDEFKKRFIVI